MMNVARMSLKAARANNNMSQKAAAEALGISNKTLSNWESGSSYPKADQILKICDLYGVAYDDLIFFTE